MAGDWIKFETATPDKPEIWLIAESAGIDPDAVVGKLLRIWIWFDQHTETANAPSVSKLTLDRLVGVSGFCNRVISAGWMHEKNGQISLPNFDRHNGKTAKNRALTAKRVAKHLANAKLTPRALPREQKILEKDLPDGNSKKKTLPAENWQPSDTTRDWFADQPFRFTVDDMTEQYVQGCRAKGHKYIDHDAAFRNWSKRRHETDQRAGAARETQAGRFARRLGIA